MDDKNLRRKMTDMGVTMHGKQVTLIGKSVKKGDSAPMFYAHTPQMKAVTLDDFMEDVLIITTFPSVDTPVCSAQVHRFNRIASTMSSKVAVVGISCDLPFAQQRYCAAEGIDRVHTLSDYRAHDFGLKYGLFIEEVRLLARSVIVLDKDRKVVYVDILPEITEEPDYEKALKVVKSMIEERG